MFFGLSFLVIIAVVLALIIFERVNMENGKGFFLVVPFSIVALYIGIFCEQSLYISSVMIALNIILGYFLAKK
jgi:hypothetical protein